MNTDVVVIGLGPGGESVANRLLAAGVDVVGVEAELVGGECPYWACIPTKMMVRAADAVAETRRIPDLAGHSAVAPTWWPVATRIRDDATGDWDDTPAARSFESAGGRLLRGRGRIVGPNRVSVTPTAGSQPDQVVEASRGVVVASGTVPAIPPISGLDHVPYWTSRDAAAATSLPASLLLLGGGPIGLELAQVMARFGVEVTVLETLDRLAGGEEPEAGRVLTDVFASDGIDVRTSTKVVSARSSVSASRAAGTDGNGQVTVTLDDDTELTADRLLVATGRRVEMAAVGLDQVGVDTDGDAVSVDERMRAAPGVWAVGDVTGQGAFTHVAVHQGQVAADDILGRSDDPVAQWAVPRVTFTDPEVGAVGLTEQAARSSGLKVRAGYADLPDTTRGWIHKVGNEGFIKVVEDTERGVLVGATAMGPSGGEVLGLLTLAVNSAVPVDDLRAMMWAFPTFHRALDDALSDL